MEKDAWQDRAKEEKDSFPTKSPLPQLPILAVKDASPHGDFSNAKPSCFQKGAVWGQSPTQPEGTEPQSHGGLL